MPTRANPSPAKVATPARGGAAKTEIIEQAVVANAVVGIKIILWYFCRGAIRSGFATDMRSDALSAAVSPPPFAYTMPVKLIMVLRRDRPAISAGDPHVQPTLSLAFFCTPFFPRTDWMAIILI